MNKEELLRKLRQITLFCLLESKKKGGMTLAEYLEMKHKDSDVDFVRKILNNELD
jgi:hypothetical protein